MKKKYYKGFTLVELIVVITILAILGTIAFLSFSGYSSWARNTKRVSDINNIVTKIELKSLGGDNLFSLVADSGSRITNNIKISGREGTGVTIGQYNAGNISLSNLGISDNLAMDPSGSSLYKVGITNINKLLYEVAGTIESGNELDIYTNGSWLPRKKIKFDRDGDTAHSDVYTIVESDDFNIRSRDIVQISTGTYEVLRIRGNKLYLDKVVDPTGSRVFLVSDESIHLIKKYTSSDYPIEGGRGTLFVPYLLK